MTCKGDPARKCEHSLRSAGLSVLPIFSRPDIFLSMWFPVMSSWTRNSTQTRRVRWDECHLEQHHPHPPAGVKTPNRLLFTKLSHPTSHISPSRDEAIRPQTTRRYPERGVSQPSAERPCVQTRTITIQDSKQEFQKKTHICFLIKTKAIQLKRMLNRQGRVFLHILTSSSIPVLSYLWSSALNCFCRRKTNITSADSFPDMCPLRGTPSFLITRALCAVQLVTGLSILRSVSSDYFM